MSMITNISNRDGGILTTSAILPSFLVRVIIYRPRFSLWLCRRRARMMASSCCISELFSTYSLDQYLAEKAEYFSWRSLSHYFPLWSLSTLGDLPQEIILLIEIIFDAFHR